MSSPNLQGKPLEKFRVNLAPLAYNPLRARGDLFRTEPAAARGFDHDTVASLGRNRKLAGQFSSPAIGANPPCPPFSAITTTVQTIGCDFASICQQRYARGCQDFDFSNHTVPPTIPSNSARPPPDLISAQAQRIGIFESFYRRIERIGHMGMHAGDPVRIRARPHAATNRFII